MANNPKQNASLRCLLLVSFWLLYLNGDLSSMIYVNDCVPGQKKVMEIIESISFQGKILEDGETHAHASTNRIPR